MRHLIRYKSKITWGLFVTFFLLLLLHIFHLYWLNTKEIYLEIFDFDSEKNLPSVFSTLNLLFSSYLLYYISKFKTKEEMRMLWRILALIFVFLAIDELSMIHEGQSKIFKSIANNIDFLYFAWVIPYSILLIFLAFFYLKFFLDLPNKFKWLFGISGLVYVLGAIGFELLSAPRAKYFGKTDIYFVLFLTIEESLEFVGIILFNYSLLTYLKEKVNLGTGKK